jgi:hypothetical protein
MLENLFLLKLRRFNFGIYPRALNMIAGLISVEDDDKRFDERFNSSKCLSSLRSSGNVIRLFP